VAFAAVVAFMEASAAVTAAATAKNGPRTRRACRNPAHRSHAVLATQEGQRKLVHYDPVGSSSCTTVIRCNCSICRINRFPDGFWAVHGRAPEVSARRPPCSRARQTFRPGPLA
jgi:hypothetical protein